MRMERLNDAFRTLAGWDAFTAAVQHPRLTASRAWVEANPDLVVAQAGPRHLLPGHHSTAALDAHLGAVRDYLDSRSFVLRNQRRTTLMLGLVRLHLNVTDDPRRYTELLRSWLTTNAGLALPSAPATTQEPATNFRHNDGQRARSAADHKTARRTHRGAPVAHQTSSDTTRARQRTPTTTARVSSVAPLAVAVFVPFAT